MENNYKDLLSIGCRQLFVLSVIGFGQLINATVGGTVSDASGALIPGVMVAATNTGTGIVNTLVSMSRALIALLLCSRGPTIGCWRQ